jgi:hypothetical protein
MVTHKLFEIDARFASRAAIRKRAVIGHVIAEVLPYVWTVGIALALLILPFLPS